VIVLHNVFKYEWCSKSRFFVQNIECSELCDLVVIKLCQNCINNVFGPLSVKLQPAEALQGFTVSGQVSLECERVCMQIRFVQHFLDRQLADEFYLDIEIVGAELQSQIELLKCVTQVEHTRVEVHTEFGILQ